MANPRWTSLHWLVAIAPGSLFAITNFLQNAAIAADLSASWTIALVFALFLLIYNGFALTMRVAWAAQMGLSRSVSANRYMVLMHLVIMAAAGTLQFLGIAWLSSLMRDPTEWDGMIGHYFVEVVATCSPIWAFAYVVTWVLLRHVRQYGDDVLVSPPAAKLEFRDGGKVRYVDTDDIMFVEAQGNYVRIVTGDGKLMPRLSISKLEAALPDDTFVRTHRSLIVKKSLVSEIQRSETGAYRAVLSDGRVVQISRHRLTAVRQALAGQRCETFVTES